MKTVYQNSVTSQERQIQKQHEPIIPVWISAMGLEWLYRLLNKIEASR